jgi:hypothetical protein
MSDILLDQGEQVTVLCDNLERHRLRSPVAAVRQALVRMLTWPIISAGKSKRQTFTAKAIANYGRDCALPGFARALAACAG